MAIVRFRPHGKAWSRRISVATLVALGVLFVSVCSSQAVSLLQQTRDPLDSNTLSLFDFQQEQQGVYGSATPGAEMCDTARLSERRAPATGLGQGNMALQVTYVLPENSPDCWAGVWFQRDSLDISDYAALVFDMRGAEGGDFPPALRVELKQAIDDPDHPFAMLVYELHGLGPDWQKFQISLGDFVPYLEEPPLENWEDIDEIVFAVESEFSAGGTYYLDNIALDSEIDVVAPTLLPSLVLAHFEPEYSVQADTSDEDNLVAYENIVDPASGSTVAELSYTTLSDWATFSIQLDELDASAYEAVTFLARAAVNGRQEKLPKFEVYVYSGEAMGQGPRAASPELISLVELKSEGWQKYVLPFASFVGEGNSTEFWSNLDEVSFAFHPDLSGEAGVVYLDNVQFEYLPTQSGQATETVLIALDEEAEILLADEAADDEIVPEEDIDEEPIEDGQEAVGDANADAAPNALVEAAENQKEVAADEPAHLYVADVDFCEAMDSGGAYQDPTTVVDTYPSVEGRGCVLKVEVDTNSWGAYWFQIGPADLSGFSRLVFDMYVERDNPGTLVNIELRRSPDELSVYGIDSPPEGWRTVSIPFSDFYGAGYGKELTTLKDVAELVFVAIPPQGIQTNTTIYLDNIHFSQ